MSPKRLFLSSLCFVVILWIISPVILAYLFPELEHRSKFADTYAVINSLFSGLGFVALIYTIGVQQKSIANEINLAQKNNRLLSLTTLLQYYSMEEGKYKDVDQSIVAQAKAKKEHILTLVDKEIHDEK